MKREEYPRNARMNLNAVVGDVLSKKATRDESKGWMNSDMFEGRRRVFEHEDGDLFHALNFSDIDEKKTVKKTIL